MVTTMLTNTGSTKPHYYRKKRTYALLFYNRQVSHKRRVVNHT